MEPFKNQFSLARVRLTVEAIRRVYPEFPMKKFLRGLEGELEKLEMKGRMLLVAERIADCLPADVPEMFRILVDSLAKDDEDEDGVRSFAVWPLTEIVAQKGGGHFLKSMNALAEMTSRFSAEFAIRPFIRNHPEEAFLQLHEWCGHEDAHVRRLVSEGSRPLLPWGGNLPQLFEPPYPTLDLLDKLYRDPSDYVRLSVSNHLNDFSKSRPELVISILERWLGEAPEDVKLQKLARHACRTLLKKGHTGAMALQGYGSAETLRVESFELESPTVVLGGALEYTMVIRNLSTKPSKVMCDFVIHLLKANGTHSAKVFKGRGKVLAGGEVWSFRGKHPLKPVTTRVYYPGLHRIEPQLNGQGSTVRDFHLDIPS